MLALAGLALGFLVGFAWGARTREALPGVTSAAFTGGKVIVTIDAAEAARQGLGALLS